ncbi:MAG: hypothetical protein ACYDAG_03040 [Chloroflexota bacterium]
MADVPEAPDLGDVDAAELGDADGLEVPAAPAELELVVELSLPEVEVPLLDDRVAVQLVGAAPLAMPDAPEVAVPADVPVPVAPLDGLPVALDVVPALAELEGDTLDMPLPELEGEALDGPLAPVDDVPAPVEADELGETEVPAELDAAGLGLPYVPDGDEVAVAPEPHAAIARGTARRPGMKRFGCMVLYLLGRPCVC